MLSSRKANNLINRIQTWQKKPNFGPILTNLAQIWVPKKFFVLTPLDVRHCCKLLLHTISRKTKESKLRKWQEN